MKLTITDAQSETRRAYFNGAIGVAVSGTVWLISGGIASGGDINLAMLALFFGGMLINPISTLIESKILKLPPVSKQNSLIWIGLYTVPFILIGMYAGYMLAPKNPALFFAFTLMAIGARYLSFQVIYGLKHFLFLGLALLGLGFLGAWLNMQSAALLAISGGIIEIIFAVIISRPQKTLADT